ncbi:MAG: DNA-3-methyladenine glycosylase [Bacteroidales bacterium]|jgi:DNA-3-methyladenine glycosylase II
MEYLKYGENELNHLRSNDRQLGEVIDRLGFLERPFTQDLFVALVESIISQQISSKAAVTVTKRVYELLGEITPENIANTNHFHIQKCGMSLKKASYIKIAADAILSGVINLGEFAGMSDQQVIDKLTILPGVGVWTAEMLMIFSLQRQDVLSYDDLVIRRAMSKIYGIKDIDREAFEMYRKRYSPYCSVASLYLWEVAEN